MGVLTQILPPTSLQINDVRRPFFADRVCRVKANLSKGCEP